MDILFLNLFFIFIDEPQIQTDLSEGIQPIIELFRSQEPLDI